MSTDAMPRYSAHELRAAAAALAAGEFTTTTTTAAATGSAEPESTQEREWRTVERAASGITPGRVHDRRRSHGSGRAEALALWTEGTPLVRVRAANAGAGASTIALALADVADLAGIRTRVLDAAAPAWSGLVGATRTELGADQGWRRGRRGEGVLIDRVEQPVREAGELPPPRPAEGVDLTVLDAGWSMRELAAAGPGAWIATTPARVEVLVTRSCGLALSQTEAALSDLEDRVARGEVVVVVVGAARWSDHELACAGRLLRTAREQGAVVFAPLLAAKALPGLGPDRLPKQLTNPSQRLLERIATITGPLTANRI